MKHSTYFQNVRAMVLASATMALFSTDLAAKTEEPTLSIPKATPFKPVCVGWPEKEGCVATISAALKNAKSNSTIFVRAGSGIADNLTISKGVTICAASQKDKCLQYPSDQPNFRLIRRDETKPCIRINLSSRPGKITIRGMEIRDIADADKTCITNTKTNAGSSTLAIDRSTLEDVSLRLSGLARLTVTNTLAAYTYAGSTRPTWTVSNSAAVDVREDTRFVGMDFEVANSAATLSIRSFDFGALTIEGTGTSHIVDSTFRRSTLVISGSAIREVEGNWFNDSAISLNHQGLVFFNNNVIETDPYRKPSPDEAAIMIDNGVNRISNNHFGSQCTGFPSEPGSACGCTLTPALQLSSTTAEDRTTRISGNKVCTNHPAWIGGNIGPDETVRGNCAITYDPKINSASRKHYRNFRRPPSSELIVRLSRSGESWSCH